MHVTEAGSLTQIVQFYVGEEGLRSVGTFFPFVNNQPDGIASSNAVDWQRADEFLGKKYIPIGGLPFDVDSIVLFINRWQSV